MTWDRELIALLFEFILSLVIILGGGFLMFHGTQVEVTVSVVTAVVTFWFSKRQAEYLVAKGQASQQVTQQAPVIIPQPQSGQAAPQQAVQQPTQPPQNGGLGV